MRQVVLLGARLVRPPGRPRRHKPVLVGLADDSFGGALDAFTYGTATAIEPLCNLIVGVPLALVQCEGSKMAHCRAGRYRNKQVGLPSASLDIRLELLIAFLAD